MQDSPGYDSHLVKVIFVGDSGVGKTCLMERVFSDKFDVNTPSTIGCDFRFKRLKFDQKNVGLTLWDTAGQDRFQALTANYYRGAQGVLYVFDVTRRETLQSLEAKWMADFDSYATYPNAVKMIIANKVDLEDERQVSSDEGAAFARDHNCLYQETSAKTDYGVYDAFIWGLVCSIMDTPELLRSSPASIRPELGAPAEERKKQKCLPCM